MVSNVNSITVSLADIVDVDDMVSDLLYCGDCELIEPKFVPEKYPDELKCSCVEGETNNEFLFW